MRLLQLPSALVAAYIRAALRPNAGLSPRSRLRGCRGPGSGRRSVRSCRRFATARTAQPGSTPIALLTSSACVERALHPWIAHAFATFSRVTVVFLSGDQRKNTQRTRVNQCASSSRHDRSRGVSRSARAGWCRTVPSRELAVARQQAPKRRLYRRCSVLQKCVRPLRLRESMTSGSRSSASRQNSPPDGSQLEFPSRHTRWHRRVRRRHSRRVGFGTMNACHHRRVRGRLYTQRAFANQRHVLLRTKQVDDARAEGWKSAEPFSGTKVTMSAFPSAGSSQRGRNPHRCRPAPRRVFRRKPRDTFAHAAAQRTARLDLG